MNKSLFNESLNYIAPEFVIEHTAQKSKLIKSKTIERKSVSSFIKRPIGVLVAVLLVIASVGSVFAVSIIKSKNKYQADTERNLVFTPITAAGEGDGTGETFTDAKTDIYCKMLNTIDKIDLLELTMKTSMISDEETTVTYKIGIDEGISNEIVTENGKIITEAFCSDGKVALVNHVKKTYDEYYLPAYSREDTPYIPLSDRIKIDEDGMPCYYYRRNITNCPLASYCIVPQEFTFSYLKDFERWKIVGEAEYLGRKCAVIEGTTSPYISEKHGCDSFKMTVDSETGILMAFEGYKNGSVTRYMYVTDCTFDVSPDMASFDQDNYIGYTKTVK